jgi:hypothetical protein
MIEVLQPVTNPQPAHFTIYGMFGFPALSNVFTFPGIGGTMALTACPFALGDPLMFNMFTTIELFDPCGAVTTGPGHLRLGSAIGLPDPLLINLQGAIGRSPCVWEFANGIIWNVE